MISVSVVIPAHNSERFIGDAVRSALAQDRPPLEIIVVDDGSTDGTADALFGLPVTLLRLPHGGQASARNAGVAASRGDSMAFLDSDDVWPPWKLGLQCFLLECRADIDMAFGRAVQFRGSQDSMSIVGEPADVELPGTALVRRRAWDRIPGMDPSLRVGEFIDWVIRAREAGMRSGFVQATVLFRRLHEGNLGSSGYGRQDYVRILKASLDRRRARERER